jgi:hypothetical protein
MSKALLCRGILYLILAVFTGFFAGVQLFWVGNYLLGFSAFGSSWFYSSWAEDDFAEWYYRRQSSLPI